MHQDTTGGCNQTVLTVSGAPAGGFAAIFQDERKGNVGLFLAHLDAEGRVAGEQLPISDQVGTARELFPAVVAGGDGAGAFVWMLMAGRSQAHLRFFEPDRESWSGMIPISSAKYRNLVKQEVKEGTPTRDVRGPTAIDKRGAPTLPRVAMAPDGRLLVSWQESGRVYLQAFVDGYAERQASRLNHNVLPALGPPHVAVDALGRILCAWDTEEGIDVFTVFESKRKTGQGPAMRPTYTRGTPGKLRRVLPDPEGGWWLLADHEETLILRHLGSGGVADGDDLVVAGQSVRAADLATWEHGLVLLSEQIEERAPVPTWSSTESDLKPVLTRTLELTLLDKGGQAGETKPLRWSPSVRTKGAFLATEGGSSDRVLITWNDDRGTDEEVYYAFLTSEADGPVLGDETRWNDDEASSYQMHSSVASIGSRALVAWTDERHGEGEVYVRLLGADRAWLGDEIAVGDALPNRDRRMQRAATAMNLDGRFLVCWKESDGPRKASRLRAQVFGSDGRPSSGAFDVDPGFEVTTAHAAAAVALEDNHGYVITWIRPGRGPVARRLSLSGELVGAPWRISDRPIESASNPELERLDSSRLLCVWDELGAPKSRVITGRFLGHDARPIGKELRFDWSGQGGDIDPELAPTGDGGFLLAWTGRDGPPRDIFARFYDAAGLPAGPPIGISSIRNEQDYCDVARLEDDQGYIIVWEDDLSGVDHSVARRIAPDRKTLGEIAMLDAKVGKHIEVRHAPRVAPLDDGFVSLWADHAASRGVDVVARVFGPGFDVGLAPALLPEEE